MERADGLRPAGAGHHRGHLAVDLRRHRAAPRGSFYDATTIFPDHVAARITAIAALAAFIGREHSGTGAHVHISQAEAAVNQLATAYVAEAARAGAAAEWPTIPRSMRSIRAKATTSGA